MRVLIIGLGSIAHRHIKNIKTIDPNVNIAVLRQHSKSSDVGELKEFISEVFFDERKALDWNPDTVFITNPSPFHISTALIFARKNIHLFLEKPISDRMDNIDELLNECKKRNLILMVGYVLRFFKPFCVIKEAIDQGKIGQILCIRATVGRYLLDWRPGRDYRTNLSARKDLGGGVVLELSHELDYVRWMAGEIKEVSAIMDTVSGLDIDVEDIAEINVRFENNAIGNIHIDMIDHEMNRFCRIIGSQGTIVWDSRNGECVRFYCAHTKEWTDLWRTESLNYNQMYINELEHFFDCVKAGKKPLVDGIDGRRVVEVASAAKQSAQKGKTIKL